MKRRRRAGEPEHFVPLEKDGAEREGALMEIADKTRPIDERLIDAAVDARVREALKTLPAAYRMIVVMRDVEELTTREVAAVTGYSEANVKKRLSRARGMLRAVMRSSGNAFQPPSSKAGGGPS